MVGYHKSVSQIMLTPLASGLTSFSLQMTLIIEGHFVERSDYEKGKSVVRDPHK